MSGNNTTASYLGNPYFDGVISPITTQGEVTLNCRQDRMDVEQRRLNIQTATLNATSYPGGDVLDNLHVMPHELVFGFRSKQGRNAIPGHPNQIGWTALNGINWGEYSTDEELEAAIRFIGLAKTPFIFDNVNQLKHGYTAIGVGTGTTFNTGEQEFFPGDKIKFQVIPRPPTPGAPLGSGQYGSGGPGGRQGNPRVGTPRGKLRMRINPSRFNDARPSINAAVSGMLKPYAEGGVSDVPFEALMSSTPIAGFKKLKPIQEHAMSLMLSDCITLARGCTVLVNQGIMQWGSASSELGVVQAIGCFETQASRRTVCNQLINTWYLGLTANSSQSATYMQNLKNSIPAGFNRRNTRPRRDQSLSSRFVQLAINLPTWKTVGFARAVHFEARKHIGMALSYSRPGQRLDVLLGHFLESY